MDGGRPELTAIAGLRRPLWPRARVQSFPVTLIGEAARRALGRAARGRVCAVFRRSFYCQGACGSMLCLGPASIGAGPLNAICAPPEGSLEESGLWPGAPVDLDEEAIRVDGRFVFPLARARRWQPPRVARGWDCSVLASGLATLAVAVRRRRPEGGLAPLIAPLAEAAVTGEARHTLDRVTARSPLLHAASRGVLALTEWLRTALSTDGARAHSS